MLRKFTKLLRQVKLKKELHLIDGKKLVSNSKSNKEISPSISEAYKIIRDLNDDEADSLLNSQLSKYEKILLFDILTLFNCIEFNFNRVLGLNSNNCASTATILRDRNNPSYQKLFNEESASTYRDILTSNIVIRHLIAHEIARRHTSTKSIVFFTSNKKDWNNKLRKRKENREEFLHREDSDILLNEISNKSVIYAVATISSLESLRDNLTVIDEYFARYAAEMTS